MTVQELMAKYGYPVDNSIKKAGIYTPGTYGGGTFWEPLFGGKAWSWLNEEANIFAILPKEPWGKSGWRTITTRAHSTGGGIDADAQSTVPTAQSITFYQMYAWPKIMAHRFDIGEMTEFVSGVDDAIDLLPVYREQTGLDHAFCINYQLGLRMESSAAAENVESIDRIVHSQSEIQNNSEISDAESNLYSSAYNLNSATTWDAQVNHNDAR